MVKANSDIEAIKEVFGYSIEQINNLTIEDFNKIAQDAWAFELDMANYDNELENNFEEMGPYGGAFRDWQDYYNFVN